MATTLKLDLKDPDMQKMLEGCEDGEHVEFTVAGKLNKESGEVDVDEVKYVGDEGQEGSPKEEASETPEEEAKEDAGKGPMKKQAPAVAILIHGGGKPK